MGLKSNLYTLIAKKGKKKKKTIYLNFGIRWCLDTRVSEISTSPIENHICNHLTFFMPISIRPSILFRYHVLIFDIKVNLRNSLSVVL